MQPLRNLQPPPPAPATSPLPHFSVYDPAAGGQAPTPVKPDLGWTFCQCWTKKMRAGYLAAGRSIHTVRLCDQVASIWAAATTDPPLMALDDSHAAAFVAALQEGRSVNTANKLRAHASRMFRTLCPRGPRRHDRGNWGLLVESPWFELPDRQRPDRDRDFTREELRTWFQAALAAPPSGNLLGLHAGVFTAALVLFCYNTAVRIDTALKATWPMLARWRPGYLSAPPEIMKGRKNGQRIYLNTWARAAIAVIRSMAGPDEPRLFPWRGWPGNNGWFYERCRRLIRPLAIRPGIDPFHGLRATCATWLAEASGDGMLVSIVLGHAQSSVAVRHYINGGIAARWLDQLPQPWDAIGPDGKAVRGQPPDWLADPRRADPQRRLF